MSTPINRDLMKYVLKRQNDLVRNGKIPKNEPFKDLSESKALRDIRAAMFPKFDEDDHPMNVLKLLERWKAEATEAIAFNKATLDQAAKSSTLPVSLVEEKVDGFQIYTTYKNVCIKSISPPVDRIQRIQEFWRCCAHHQLLVVLLQLLGKTVSQLSRMASHLNRMASHLTRMARHPIRMVSSKLVLMFLLPTTDADDDGSLFPALKKKINWAHASCNELDIAHQRVRVTRVHSVVTLAELLQHVRSPIKDGSICDTSSTSSPQPSSLCSIHEMAVICTCSTCSGAGLCLACVSLHESHQLALPQDVHSCLKSMIADSKQRGKRMDDAIESVHRMTERVDASAQSVASELRSAIHTQVEALEERKRELLQNLDVIRQAKLASLKTQGDTLTSNKNSLAQVLTEAEHMDSDDEGHLRRVYEKILHLYSTYVSLEPQENDYIKFTAPDLAVIQSNRSLGQLISGPCSATSTLIGEGLRRAIRDRACSVLVQLRDACGKICSFGTENDVSATLLSPTGKPLEIQVGAKESGVIAINYLPTVDGAHILNVAIRGVPISECPVSIDVRRGRNYSDIAARGELFSFGKEGSGDGELCRPWGICIDLLGRVLVADRSNNRIQVFDRDGNYLFKFGTGGTLPGQFDRPAGISSNTLNHIIVADKDNHRIQVFDEHGSFLLKFDERGRPVGFFNYPWGVATNSSNNIAVSDTRNHRVQIFSPSGQFLRKCGFDTAYFYKHLDSPRGLCYLADGTLLITDFNNHRLAILTRSSDMKVYGSEGEVEGMFCRPQGVKIDPEGHILVCDSLNNRIQVFSSEDMHCVAVFGQSPSGFQMPAELPSPYQSNSQLNPFMSTSAASTSSTSGPSSAPRSLLDRPTDLAISPDGRVYVVDFGNNCIRVF